MEELRNNKQATDDEPLKPAPLNAEASYPAAIEKMSEKWRAIRQNQPEQQGNFVQRNFFSVGIGVALLIIALLVVIGGFAFLVWNAQ